MSVVPKKKKRIAHWKKWVIGVVSAIALYTIGGFLIAPMIIRAQFTKEIQAFTGLSSQFEKIHVNPYTLTVLVEGFRAGPDDNTDWVTLKSLHADLQLATLFTEGFVLNDVMLEQPELLVHWEKSGSINLNSVVTKIRASTNSGPAEIPPAAIGHFSISNAIVRWQDDFLSPGFAAELSDIDLTFTNFHILRTNAFSFNAALDSDAAIGASGEASILPLKTVVSVGLANLRLENYADYIPGWSPIQLQKAHIAGRLNISIDLGGEPQEFDISSGDASISDLELRSAGANDPILTVSSIAVSGLEASLAGRNAAIQELLVNGSSIAINRGTNGVTDWQVWVEQILANIPPSETTNSKPSTPWNWTVGKFSAENVGIRANDHSVAGPVELTVKNGFASVGNLGPDMSQSLPIQLGFELESGGSGTISGDVTPMPFAANLKLAVDNFYFPIGQPYVRDVLRMNIKNGTVSVDGDAKFTLSETNTLKAFYLGDIQVSHVEVEEESGLPFARVSAVEIDDLEIDWPLDDFKLKSVFVNEPAAHIYLREDGTANVEEMVPQSITEQIYQQLNQAWKLLQFEVDDITLTNGFLHVEDRSITPNMVNRITNLFVKLTGLVPEATKPAKLNVGGNILPRGPSAL